MTVKDFIKKQEGFCHDNKDGTVSAYLDKTGHWTIGWGNTYIDGRAVVKGDKITYAKAQEIFDKAFDEVKLEIKKKSKRALSTNQLNALTSFAYNAGTPRLFGSTLWKLLQSGSELATVADQFNLWVYSTNPNGVKEKLSELVERRHLEKDLFLTV